VEGTLDRLADGRDSRLLLFSGLLQLELALRGAAAGHRLATPLGHVGQAGGQLVMTTSSTGLYGKN
jgi:hypothetical protein